MPLRVKGSAGTMVNLVMSKTWVSPVNKQSIPRLELLSAHTVTSKTRYQCIGCTRNGYPAASLFHCIVLD